MADFSVMRPVLEKMAETLWSRLRRSVTPITAIKDDQPRQWGTGTFLRIADDSFLVTACHVWDTAVEFGLHESLHIFDFDGQLHGDATLQPVPLNARLHRAKDPADVAVFHLDPEVVAALPGRQFLRLSDIRLRPQGQTRCWVFGFPTDLAGQVPASSQFRFDHFFMLAPFWQGPNSFDNYDKNFHLLLDAARDDLAQIDGSPADLPRRLNGISGSSIWQTDWFSSVDPEKWNTDSIRIVGVQTGYFSQSSVIKATYWGAVANVLYQARPDLRTAIELTLGPAKTRR